VGPTRFRCPGRAPLGAWAGPGRQVLGQPPATTPPPRPRYRPAMATLHIEHGIRDFETWKAAFDRFAPMRKQFGVTAVRIHHPADDRSYIILQLDFPAVEQARSFLGFLESKVWSTPANSPGLVGSPIARVLVSAS
jgi:hypothetical protein